MTGFYVAFGAMIVSYLPRRERNNSGAEYVILTNAMLEQKDHGYEAAIASLRSGHTILCDGLSIAMQPDNVVVLATTASCRADELDEARALQDGERARKQFERVVGASPEIAALALDRTLWISLLTDYGAKGAEICQMKDGQVEWRIQR